jgi:hypothetical protein
MATLVSEPVRYVADQVVDHCGYKSAVLSGIKPNVAHLKSGGYHCAVKDLLAYGNGNDYSNTRPDDRGWNPQYGAAVDVSMVKADLVLAYGRVHAVWADQADPRRRYFNAVNVWDGTGDATRLNFDKNTAGYADATHKFHVHAELRRRYLLDPKAARAMVSMFKGESKLTWLAAEEGDDMSWTEDVITNPSWRADAKTNPTVQAKFALYAAWNEAHAANIATAAILAQLKALTGKDFTDEAAIIAGVLAGLDPAAIAAAIPAAVAQQVADNLAARLAA